MDPLIIVVLVLVVGVAALLLVRRRQNAPPVKKKAGSMESLDTVAAWPPEATRVLTVAERKAYSALRSGLPEHIILAQVPLSRFMKVPTRNSYSEWLRRVGLMSVDMVICDSSSQVIGVVDVRSGEGKENERARQRHARMDRVLQAAGIPVHIWLDNAIPSATAARDALLGMPKEVVAPTTARAVMRAPAHPVPPEAYNPVEPEALLEAEEQQTAREYRDPPPSTWFDNLESDAMPLHPRATITPPGAGAYRPPAGRH